MMGSRIEKSDLSNYTLGRLTDELAFVQAKVDSESTVDQQIYLKDLKDAIMQKPQGLSDLHQKAAKYLQDNSGSSPSERLPVPKVMAGLLDWGLSLTGVITTNQKYAKRIISITEKALELFRRNERNSIFNKTSITQDALTELEKIYQEMRTANIKRGHVIDMLIGVFAIYNYSFTQQEPEARCRLFR